MVNLSAQIRHFALRTPDKVALVYEDQRITYADFHDRIVKLGGWLKAQGVQPDHVVAALMKNSAAFLELAYAVSHIGAVFLPINFRLATEEVDYIFANSGAVMLMVDEELAGVARNIMCKKRVDDEAQRDTRVISEFHPDAPM